MASFSITKTKHLNKARGVGAGGRLSLDIEKLKDRGWSVTTRESTHSGSVKTFFIFRNPQGKLMKSAKEVKEQLAEEGMLDEMLVYPAQPREEISSTQQYVSADADYDPPIKRTKSNEQE